MLTKEEIQVIIDKTELLPIEKLEVIRKYIYDKKAQDVGVIKVPADIINEFLMNEAYVIAKDYYMKLYAVKEQPADQTADTTEDK